MSQVLKIEKQLRAASETYYNGETENLLLSDQEFDRLRDKLAELDPDNSFLKEVGATSTTALAKVQHVIPMGSLDKMNTDKELKTWFNTLSKTITEEREREVVVSDKLDGISIEIIFKDGKFVQAITRGDGQVGDDVTHTIKNAQGFPHKIDADDGHTYVRCEAVLMLKTWRQHFSNTANPRNAVAGVVRRTSAVGSENITCIAFDVEWENDSCMTELEKIEWLEENKFRTVDTTQILGRDIDKNLPLQLEQMLKQRESLPFEADGAVIKINSLLQQRKLGERDGRPKWARAWKFPASGGHTKLLGVEWTVGTQGTITPVAKVAPVSVGGTTIQNVTLHNADEIERLGIKIGDTVEVVRAGDVIPQIIRVVSKGNSSTLIKLNECPGCGASVKRDGPRMVCCMGDKCPAAVYKRIAKWVKKRNIMFLGDSTLEKLVEAGAVGSVLCLYKMTQAEMVQAGLGKRMSEKILAEIEKSRKVTLADFLGSLSIDMLGRREAANLVTAGFDTLDKWKSMSHNDLLKLDGFQATKATRIANGVEQKWNEIEALSDELKVLALNKKEKKMSSKIESKSFCFTGKMNYPRKELEEMVAAAGGRIASVSKNLDYLVIADVNSTSSKAQKARKLGVKMISEDDFLAMT